MSKTVPCPKCGSSVEGGTGFGMVTCASCGEFILMGELGVPEPVVVPPIPKIRPPPPPILHPPPLDKIPVIEFDAVLDIQLDVQPEAHTESQPESQLAPTEVIPSGSEMKAFEFSFDGDKLTLEDPIEDFKVKESKAEISKTSDSLAQNSKATDSLAAVNHLQQTEVMAPTLEVTVFSEGPSVPEISYSEAIKKVEVPVKSSPATALAPSQFRDVVDFANLEQESSGTGGLVYDIVIKGIDTVETRQEMAHCLGDKRLKLNANEILKTIQAGELNLKELNPVKASVLMGVIKHLSLKVSWTSRQLIKGVFVFLILAGFSVHASDWARHEINLKGYATKIENMEEDIRALIVKKNQNTDPKERDEILKDIIKKNQELKSTYLEFKKEKEHVRFEHPEQGDQTERKYKHVKLKSIDELEDEVGLQGQLSRIKNKVEETYPSAEKSVDQAGDSTKDNFNKSSKDKSKIIPKATVPKVETDQD